MDYIWRRLRHIFQRDPKTRLIFDLNQEAHFALQHLAEEETRSESEIAGDLLADTLARLQADVQYWKKWQNLTPRQQQVAALICLGYTNRQTAARLTVSPETVKTHVRNILYKFYLQHKTDLLRTLSGWDFSAWEK